MNPQSLCKRAGTGRDTHTRAPAGARTHTHAHMQRHDKEIHGPFNRKSQEAYQA